MFSIKSRLVIGEMVLPTWISTSRDVERVLLDQNIKKEDVYWQALPILGEIPQKARASIPFLTAENGVFVDIKKLGTAQCWLDGSRLYLDIDNLRQVGVMLDDGSKLPASVANWRVEVKIADIVSASLAAHFFHTKPSISGHPSNCFNSKLIKAS